jgi:hypothetical protein
VAAKSSVSPQQKGKRKKIMRARRTKAISVDSPTASAVPADAPQFPESASKPLCDVVAADIKAAIWSWHRHGVDRLVQGQRARYERDGHAPDMLIGPPCKEAPAVLANLVQAAGVAEREAVIGIVGAYVDGDTIGKIAEAIRKHRGPISASNQWAAWSKVGESKDGKAQSYIMALNLGADYALAK